MTRSAECATASFDLHSNMDRFERQILIYSSADTLHLHSNMDRFESSFLSPFLMAVGDLHSNMDRFERLTDSGRLELDALFTFQYG